MLDWSLTYVWQEILSRLNHEKNLLLERQNQCEREMRVVKKKYRDVPTALENNQTAAATTEYSLLSYTHIPNLAAMVEGEIKSSVSMSKLSA